MERIIRKMSLTQPILPKEKRVAAYARVSCGNEVGYTDLEVRIVDRALLIYDWRFFRRRWTINGITR